MFSPSPELMKSAQPGILARIFGAMYPQQQAAYNQARAQGGGVMSGMLHAAYPGANGTHGVGALAKNDLTGRGILGKLLSGGFHG